MRVKLAAISVLILSSCSAEDKIIKFCDNSNYHSTMSNAFIDFQNLRINFGDVSSEIVPCDGVKSCYTGWINFYVPFVVKDEKIPFDSIIYKAKTKDRLLLRTNSVSSSEVHNDAGLVGITIMGKKDEFDDNKLALDFEKGRFISLEHRCASLHR